MGNQRGGVVQKYAQVLSS